MQVAIVIRGPKFSVRGHALAYSRFFFLDKITQKFREKGSFLFFSHTVIRGFIIRGILTELI